MKVKRNCTPLLLAIVSWVATATAAPPPPPHPHPHATGAEELPLSKVDTNITTIPTRVAAEGSSKHKRGIFHGAAHWPGRTYASHYGYSLQLPAASTFLAARPHAFVKYHGPLYRPAAGTLLPSPSVQGTAAVQFGGVTLPAVAAVGGPAHVPVASQLPAVAAAAPSYVLRHGNAVISSYSVNYPHVHKPVVASFKPVHFHSHPHPHALAHGIHGIQPVPTYVQVAAASPATVPEISIPQFPAIPQIPEIPAIPQIPAVPQFPAIPELPSIPQIPTFPSQVVPSPPVPVPVPHFVPSAPAEQPNIAFFVPTSHHHHHQHSFFPSAVQPPLAQQPPTFVQPEAQLPAGVLPLPGAPVQPETGTAIASPQIPAVVPQFFPSAEQPPLVQQPPIFVQPEIAHIPGIAPAPLPGSTNPAPQPGTGTAVASPQIPVAPAPEAEPQQPWKPVFYQPLSGGGGGATPSSSSTPNRPSITLLPPYGSGNAPAEGYLPPVSEQSAQLSASNGNHGYRIFDQLSDDEIAHIFAEANSAHRHTHQHHQHF